MSARRKYAQGTTVPVDRSRGDISGILAAHGVTRQGWASEPEGDTLQFELAGYQYKLRIPKPTLAEIKAEHPDAYSNFSFTAAVEKEWMRRWRANVLLLKAKLEFADDDASTVVRELMPFALLKDGRTLEEAVLGVGGTALPLLAAKAGS